MVAFAGCCQILPCQLSGPWARPWAEIFLLHHLKTWMSLKDTTLWVSIMQEGQAVTFVGAAFSEYSTVSAAGCWPVREASAQAACLAISVSRPSEPLRCAHGFPHLSFPV